jgi:hypothetical protein
MHERPNLIQTLPDGTTAGVDPRKLSLEAARRLFGEPVPLSKVIRAKCLDCCCGSVAEVNRCTAVNCPLWPYRMGSRNPLRPKRPRQGVSSVRKDQDDSGATDEPR